MKLRDPGFNWILDEVLLPELSWQSHPHLEVRQSTFQADVGTEAVLLQEHYLAFVPFTKKTQEGLSAWMENVPVDKDKWEKDVKCFWIPKIFVSLL